MGEHLSIQECEKDLKTVLIENYAPFRRCLLEVNHNSLMEFNQSICNDKLLHFLSSNVDIKDIYNQLDKAMIDELSGAYLDLIDNSGLGVDISEFAESIMYINNFPIRNFHLIEDQYMKATGDAKLVRLWQKLRQPRSIYDDESSLSYSDMYEWFEFENEMNPQKNLDDDYRQYMSAWLDVPAKNIPKMNFAEAFEQINDHIVQQRKQVHDQQPFPTGVDFEGCNHLGYDFGVLQHDEAMLLKSKLEQYFGDCSESDIDKYFWTNARKQQLLAERQKQVEASKNKKQSACETCGAEPITVDMPKTDIKYSFVPSYTIKDVYDALCEKSYTGQIITSWG